jgi:hypothetical protein
VTVTILTEDPLDKHPMKGEILARIKAKDVSYLHGLIQVEKRWGEPHVVAHLERQLKKIKDRLNED